MMLDVSARVKVVIVFACMVIGIGYSGARAEDAMKPSGETILTISGEISQENTSDSKYALDLAMLDTMPQREFSTSTIWTKGKITYRGVQLKTLLDQLGAKGKTLHMIAINDYAVDVPVTDAVDGGPILATHANGKPLSVREKGPVWLIYPFDDKPEYRSEVIYSRAIWQLKAIEVRN
ncbi:molybdopterin-dependent oxidoreductase [Agrobacterium salinitolerans]